MNFNSTEILAYLGAMAWFPQIVGWIYNLAITPRLTITPDKYVTIGYTTFGPIFNLRLSINVDKKDTLIDFIGTELIHQDGSKHEFEWVGMTEFFSEVKSSSGENQLIQRDIVPISIKLSTLSLVERFFRFQESSFIENSRPIINNFSEFQQYLRKNNNTYHDEFLNSKNFDDFLKFMKQTFWWKAGKYTVCFKVRSPEKINYIDNLFEFNLNQDDIDSLEKNLCEIKTDIEFLIKKNDLVNYNGQTAIWNWRNSNLKKIKL